MPKLVPSVSVIQRTVATEAAYTLSRLQVLERLPGNPVGVAYRRPDDGLVAFMARHLPSPGFNSVVGLRAGQERHIEPLVAWYRDNGVGPRFEMVPGLGDARLGQELADFVVKVLAEVPEPRRSDHASNIIPCSTVGGKAIPRIAPIGTRILSVDGALVLAWVLTDFYNKIGTPRLFPVGLSRLAHLRARRAAAGCR